jgi:hypothetical protein
MWVHVKQFAVNWLQRLPQQVVSSCAPANRPQLWFGINLVCLVWSFLLAVAILFEDTPMDRLTGTHDYLIWSLAICLIWALEAGGLITLYCRQTGGKQLTWAHHLIELVVVIYFTVYSLRVFFI